MSYYLELLHKKGIALTREQMAARKALKHPHEIPAMRNISKHESLRSKYSKKASKSGEV